MALEILMAQRIVLIDNYINHLKKFFRRSEQF